MKVEKFPEFPILLVDDEELFLESTGFVLRSNGVNNFDLCVDSRQVSNRLNSKKYSMVFLDLEMPYIKGKELLKNIVEIHPELPVTILTASGTPETVVECMKMGAYDYIQKPVDAKILIQKIKNTIRHTLDIIEHENLKKSFFSDKLEHPEAFLKIISKSEKMRKIFKYSESISKSPRPVFIAGETGVGKELIAEAIHTASQRSGELVKVNVAGLDDNLFTDTLFGHLKGAYSDAHSSRQGLALQAEGGTLFLDEFGDLTPQSQHKLLRFCETGEFRQLGSDKLLFSDARIVLATNRDINKLVDAGTFRKDLYYRLCGYKINIPPLRERAEDIPLLTINFIERVCEELQREIPIISRAALDLLKTYHFPGNIRQLLQIVQEVVTINDSELLTKEHFLEKLELENKNEINGKEVLTHENQTSEHRIQFGNKFPEYDKMIRIYLDEALKRADWNKSIAANLCGLHRNTFNSKYKKVTE